MNDVLDISLIRMVLAFAYPIVLIIIIRRLGIPREQDIVIGSLRLTIQLIAAGFVLVWVFDNTSPWLLGMILLAMESFAIYTAYRRAKVALSPAIKRIMAIALPTGTLLSLAYFLLVVVGGSAWQDARYVIPLAGMIIGNAMTGLTLGANRLVDGMQTERESVEGALMLGARPRVAARRVVQNTFDAAIMPTINSMMTTGIVFLPGMMTGQILSGSSPLVAIKYQIVIMFGILGSVAFSLVILVEWGHRTFFNTDAQLIRREG